MLSFIARGRDAKCVSDEPLTAGSVGIQIRFVFDAVWSGLERIATFTGSGTSADIALDGENTATVPPQCLAEAGGSLLIGVRGARPDGTIIMPTVWAKAGVIYPGSAPSGVDPAQPTPDWTAQIMARLSELEARVTALEHGEHPPQPTPTYGILDVTLIRDFILA